MNAIKSTPFLGLRMGPEPSSGDGGELAGRAGMRGVVVAGDGGGVPVVERGGVGACGGSPPGRALPKGPVPCSSLTKPRPLTHSAW